jgi:hypothetical protein
MRITQAGDNVLVGSTPVTPWVEPNDMRCPKCDMDSRGITVSYCPEAIDPRHIGLLCFGLADEHLHVHCGRCQFSWLMQTKSQHLELLKASLARSGFVTATAADMPTRDMKHISEVDSGFTFLSPQQRKD